MSYRRHQYYIEQVLTPTCVVGCLKPTGSAVIKCNGFIGGYVQESSYKLKPYLAFLI